jgi:hypothetical protein
MPLTKLRIPLLTAALAAAGAFAVSAGAHDGGRARGGRCRTPHVTGLSLLAARRALARAGCKVVVHDSQPAGGHITPLTPDPRQLIATQSPAAGRAARTVTISLRPLCAQSAEPGPPPGEPLVKPGPTELISGLYLDGGPLVLSPRCRQGVPSAGTITVADAAGGHVIATQAVAGGSLATIALAPGSYLVTGTFADASVNGRPIQTDPVSVAIPAGGSVRLDVVTAIP